MAHPWSPAAFPLSFTLSSLDEISVFNFAAASDRFSESSLTISGLAPLTEYRVYCFVSKRTVVSKISDVVRTAQSINTTCCKTLTVTRSSSSIPSSQSAVNFLLPEYINDIKLSY